MEFTTSARTIETCVHRGVWAYTDLHPHVRDISGTPEENNRPIMARKIRDSRLESRSARLRLPVQKKPYTGPTLARGIRGSGPCLGASKPDRVVRQFLEVAVRDFPLIASAVGGFLREPRGLLGRPPENKAVPTSMVTFLKRHVRTYHVFELFMSPFYVVVVLYAYDASIFGDKPPAS